MATVDIHEAQIQLSRLLERVEAGEEMVILRGGKPIARLVPYQPAAGPRRPGAWKGRVRLAPDFEDLPEELGAAFRGGLP